MDIGSDPIQVGREWHFEDGTILPVVSGGADDNEPGGGFEFVPPSTDPNVGQNDYTPGGEEDTIGNQFLRNVNPADRPVLEKYIKDWDRGVNARFREIHSQYEPYKNIGMSPEEIRQAQALMQRIDAEPEWVYEQLANVLQQQGRLPQPQTPPSNQNGQNGFQNPWADDGIPDGFAEQFLMQQQVLQQLAENFLGSQQSQQEAQEQAELDALLGQMHDHFGQFDDNFILSQMAQGADPNQAMQAWDEMIQAEITSRQSRKPPPIVMGAGGSVPSGGVEPNKMKREDIVDYVAKSLAAAASQTS